LRTALDLMGGTGRDTTIRRKARMFRVIADESMTIDAMKRRIDDLIFAIRHTLQSLPITPRKLTNASD
jgi:hypothetical protein